jgi:NAD(P)-dependent dehydrogenase (short-subunit alcohol dehydrogenase family)
MNLSGKVVVVTGSDGALGQAVATVLGKYGARLALIAHGPAPTLAPAAASGPVHFGGVDLTQPDAARSVMDSVLKQTGRLDALINVAGGFSAENVAGGSLGAWDSMYALNLKTAVVACQAALPHLLQAGAARLPAARLPAARIVNVGAMGAVKAGAGMGAYAASKAGVAKLTESLAAELKDKGITVNAILPSTLDTPRNRLDMPKADFSRWVTPTEAAEVIAFLVSDEASAVTGALIPVVGRV